METFEVPVSNIVPMSKSNEIPWWNPNLEVFMRNNISELPPTVVNNLIVITRKIVDERIRSVEEKSKYSNAPSSISLQKLDLEQETDSYAFAILQLHLMSQAAQKYLNNGKFEKTRANDDQYLGEVVYQASALNQINNPDRISSAQIPILEQMLYMKAHEAIFLKNV